MAVIRKYETKEDCVRLMMDERFGKLDSTLITELDGWRDHWSFVAAFDDGIYDDAEAALDEASWYDEDRGLCYYESDYTYTGAPAWNTWFEPEDSWLRRMCEQNLKGICDLGLIAVFHDDEFWGLAVDGAGFDFYEAYWTKLYDLFGLEWHE
jgi:hypothetical protein